MPARLNDDVLTAARVTERGVVLHSYFGTVLRIQIARDDGGPMSWSDVQAVFNDRYPERWALEVRPPEDRIVDEINAYHLWVLDVDADPEPLRIDNRIVGLGPWSRPRP